MDTALAPRPCNRNRADLGALSRRLAAVLVSTALAAYAAAADEPAALRPCPDVDARVSAALDADFTDACRGARQAADFFSTLGRSVRETLTIEVTATLPAEVVRSAAGCYIEQRRRIYILPYAAFRKQRTWFHIPVDRGLYRSLATHEAAHALAACHFTGPAPTLQAKEYLAYVAMFSAMDERLRQRALRATPGQGFKDESYINALIYMFDPLLFGADAWRHYSQPGVGPAFAQAVLEGRALRD
jgi:hypothetical protein